LASISASKEAVMLGGVAGAHQGEGRNKIVHAGAARGGDEAQQGAANALARQVLLIA
jgi:hypothetical protein